MRKENRPSAIQVADGGAVVVGEQPASAAGLQGFGQCAVVESRVFVAAVSVEVLVFQHIRRVGVNQRLRVRGDGFAEVRPADFHFLGDHFAGELADALHRADGKARVSGGHSAAEGASGERRAVNHIERAGPLQLARQLSLLFLQTVEFGAGDVGEESRRFRREFRGLGEQGVPKFHQRAEVVVGVDLHSQVSRAMQLKGAAAQKGRAQFAFALRDVVRQNPDRPLFAAGVAQNRTGAGGDRGGDSWGKRQHWGIIAPSRQTDAKVM